MDAIEDRSDIRQAFIPASPADVFAAMSNPDRVARWWGPAGFTNIIYKYEFTPGGIWLLTMFGPEGTDYPCGSVFTRIEADRLFEIENVKGHHFILTIELQPRDCGTDVHWRQTFDTPDHYRRLADFIATANTQNLERLAAEVARGA
ncbi:MAG: SRPBCC domain-containing protein [Thermoleophilia bacterium]|nr:SRPBCC domain-containing protein [Thermoleophilia bacterium]